MFSLVLVKPKQHMLGLFPTYEAAERVAAAACVAMGPIEVWIFDSFGQRVA